MKKVVMYGKHSKIALYTGSETECKRYILGICEPLADGRRIYRKLDMSDGTVYDIGQPVMYQIVDAADGENGIYNEPDGNQPPIITG